MSLALTRLVVAGDRRSRLRLGGIATGVALGVCLFLLLWGAFTGLQDRDARSAWLALPTGDGAAEPSSEAVLGNDRLLASTDDETFGTLTISRMDIAATPESTVPIPGLASAPSPGTYATSPALARLIDSVPADQLGDRWGTPAGLIADSALASPDSLVVVVGHSVSTLHGSPSSATITGFSDALYGNSLTYRIIAIVGGIAVLLPVLLLVGIVTDLGSAERRERFTTLRLIGATPRDLARMAAAETALTSLVGAVAGVVLAWLLRPVVALVSINGGTLFVSDLTVSPGTVIGVVAVTVLASSGVAVARTVRADGGAPGVTRQQRERPPRFGSLIPLATGLVIVFVPTALSAGGAHFYGLELVLVGGFVVTAVGLLLAGPYLTYTASRLAGRHARSAASIIALGRIRSAPRATFRAVSGLVIALFVVTIFTAGVTSVDATLPAAGHDAAYSLPQNILIGSLETDSPEAVAAGIPQLSAVAGVTHVAAVFHVEDVGYVLTRADAASLGFLDAPGPGFVTVNDTYFNPQTADSIPLTVTDAPGIQSRDLIPALVLIATDGTAGARERARTAAETGPLMFLNQPLPVGDPAASGTGTLMENFTQLAHLGVLVTTLIAAVSLTVSTMASILDRRRALGLLRLMGMPVPTLRRIITTETAVPLLAVVAVSIGLGVFSAWAVVTGLTQGRRSLGWPEPAAYIVLGAGLALAAIAILATFRTARASTAISVTRFE